MNRLWDSFDIEIGGQALILTDRVGPSYYLAVHFPLKFLSAEYSVSYRVIDDRELERRHQDRGSSEYVEDLLSANPSIIVICRSSTQALWPLLEEAKNRRIPILYFIDDNFFELPEVDELADPEVVQKIEDLKWRAGSADRILSLSDLTWCSTTYLEKRLQNRHPELNTCVVKYPVFLGARRRVEALRERLRRQRWTLGYYGSFLHRPDLLDVTDDLRRLMKAYSHIDLEIVGNVGAPPSLREFGGRVRFGRVEKNYLKFLENLARKEWVMSLGLLGSSSFNLAKSPIKFFESSSAGIAFACSDSPVYRGFVGSNRGFLISGGNYFERISEALDRPEELVNCLEEAQSFCASQYSWQNNCEEYRALLSPCLGPKRPLHRLRKYLPKLRKT